MRRSSILLVAVALAVVGSGGVWLFWPRVRLPTDPLKSIPADAYAVARIRVDRVLASQAYKRLVVERGQARGIEHIREICGFNPLERFSELMVFARPAPDRGVPRMAFVARGTLDHAELLDCVKKLSPKGEPALAREDIEGVPTVASKRGSSRAALIGHDGLIAGDAESVRAAIHTLLGKAPSFADDTLAAGLYREIERGSDIAAAGRFTDDLKPLLRQLATIAGPSVLALEQVRALGLNLTTRDERIVAGAVLIAEDAARARALTELAQQAVARTLAIPGVGLTPAASVLRSVQTEARGERATITGSVRVSTIEGLLELVPALQGVSRTVVSPRTEPATDAGMQKDDADDASKAARAPREKRPRIVDDDGR